MERRWKTLWRLPQFLVHFGRWLARVPGWCETPSWISTMEPGQIRGGNHGKSPSTSTNISQSQPISTNHFKVISDSLSLQNHTGHMDTFPKPGWFFNHCHHMSSPCPRASDLQRASTVPAPPKDAVDAVDAVDGTALCSALTFGFCDRRLRRMTNPANPSRRTLCCVWRKPNGAYDVCTCFSLFLIFCLTNWIYNFKFLEVLESLRKTEDFSNLWRHVWNPWKADFLPTIDSSLYKTMTFDSFEILGQRWEDTDVLLTWWETYGPYGVIDVWESICQVHV